MAFSFLHFAFSVSMMWTVLPQFHKIVQISTSHNVMPLVQLIPFLMFIQRGIHLEYVMSMFLYNIAYAGQQGPKTMTSKVSPSPLFTPCPMCFWVWSLAGSPHPAAFTHGSRLGMRSLSLSCSALIHPCFLSRPWGTISLALPPPPLITFPTTPPHCPLPWCVCATPFESLHVSSLD